MSEEKPHGGPGRESLLCSVAGRYVAVDLGKVVKVLPNLYSEPQPGGPPFLEGFANVAGRPVPIVGLRRLFELPPPSSGNDLAHRIVLCEADGRSIGLIVDEALGLAQPLNLRRTTSEDEEAGVVDEIGVIEGHLCAILEPSLVLQRLGGSRPGRREGALA